MYGRKYLGIVRSTFVIDENGILTAEFRDVKAKTSVADLEKSPSDFLNGEKELSSKSVRKKALIFSSRRIRR